MQAPLLPRNIEQPATVSKERILSRWSQFLGSIAIGISPQDAMLKHLITSAEIEACVREPEERARWTEARIAARKRAWNVLDIEDIFEKISGGMTIVEAVESIRPGGTTAFADLCCSDPELNAHYLRALKSRAVLLAEDVLKISDGDGTPDTCTTDKGGEIPNNAKVNRDKLKVDARTRLMSNWFPKLFGEKQQTQVNVQIVNHAQRLEEARQRRDTRSAAPRISHDVVEAAFREVPAPDTNEWDDVPKSTVWLENEP